MALYDDPNLRLSPPGEEYRKPDLFTMWYNKYVRGGPDPGRTYFPQSGVEPRKATPAMPTAQATAPASAATPAPGIPAMAPAPEPPVPALPVAPATPAQQTGKPSSTWTGRLTEGLQDPAKLALLSTGLSMLATPPRAVPYSTGEIIGRAGLAGVDVFQKALESKRKGELAASESQLRQAQLSHYRSLDEKIQSEIQSGKDRKKIYEDLISAGAADRIAADRGLPVELAKIAIHNAVIEGKGIDELTKRKGGAISAGLAEALGRPGLAGEDVETVSKLGSFVRTEKEHKPDFQMIQIRGGTPVLRDLNDPQVQKAIMENDVELIDEKTGSARGQLVVGEDGTVRAVDKNTGEILGVAGQIGKPTRGEGGGGERQFEFYWRTAKNSLTRKGIKDPTEEQIAAEQQKLFPRSTADPFEQWMAERLRNISGTPEREESFVESPYIPTKEEAREERERRRRQGK